MQQTIKNDLARQRGNLNVFWWVKLFRSPSVAHGMVQTLSLRYWFFDSLLYIIILAKYANEYLRITPILTS